MDCASRRSCCRKAAGRAACGRARPPTAITCCSPCGATAAGNSTQCPTPRPSPVRRSSSWPRPREGRSSSAGLPRKFLRKYLPDPDEILAKPWCAPFRPWLGHPNLWHLNRRSVPGAVAIGLFCGLIPGPARMLGPLLCAIPLGKTIPVALATTLYTNPLTIVPLYLLPYSYGSLILGDWATEAHVTP